MSVNKMNLVQHVQSSWHTPEVSCLVTYHQISARGGGVTRVLGFFMGVRKQKKKSDKLLLLFFVEERKIISDLVL